MSEPLAGRGIVITRPREQAQGLAEQIRQHGGRPTVFPAIEISPPADANALNSIIDRLDRFDIAVFISPVAVERAMSAIAARRVFPETLQVAAVGAGSARALTRHGVEHVIAPARTFDSESLLDCAELQNVAGKRVVIFRGDGGRELIARTLTSRGAEVHYAHCYRRSRPAADVAPLLDLWARSEVDAVVVTSSEGLRNLFEMLGANGQALLRTTPVFVPHPRIAAVAHELRLEKVIATASGDDGMLNALSEYFAHSTT